MSDKLTRGRSGPHVLTGLAVVLSFLFVSTLVGQHTHTDTAESAVACAVCASTHHASVAIAPQAELTEAPATPTVESRALELRENRPSAATPHRTRAPPV